MRYTIDGLCGGYDSKVLCVGELSRTIGIIFRCKVEGMIWATCESKRAL